MRYIVLPSTTCSIASTSHAQYKKNKRQKSHSGYMPCASVTILLKIETEHTQNHETSINSFICTNMQHTWTPVTRTTPCTSCGSTSGLRNESCFSLRHHVTRKHNTLHKIRLQHGFRKLKYPTCKQKCWRKAKYKQRKCRENVRCVLPVTPLPHMFLEVRHPGVENRAVREGALNECQEKFPEVQVLV